MFDLRQVALNLDENRVLEGQSAKSPQESRLRPEAVGNVQSVGRRVCAGQGTFLGTYQQQSTTTETPIGRSVSTYDR